LSLVRVEGYRGFFVIRGFVELQEASGKRSAAIPALSLGTEMLDVDTLLLAQSGDELRSSLVMGTIVFATDILSKGLDSPHRA